MTNPFQAPSELDSPVRQQFSPALRALSFIAVSIGLFAVLAYYGYPGWMSKTWLFLILPTLAGSSLLLSILGLSLPLEPTRVESFRWSPVVVNSVLAVLSVGWVALLYTVSEILVFNLVPRLAAMITTIWANWFLVAWIHGTTRGRRLLAIAAGLGMLQFMTSIADVLFVEFVE